MSKYILGIEYSGTQFKIATFVKNGRRYTLKRFDRVAANKLKKWSQDVLTNASTIKGYLTVAESAIYLQEMVLPHANKKQLENAIHWEINSLTPIPQEEAVYDYKVLQNDKQKIRAIVMLIKEEVSKGLHDTFENANIKLEAIEPSSFALARSIKIDSKNNTLLLTVDKEETNLLVLEKGYPTFTTSVAINIEHSKKNKRRLSESVLANLAENTRKTIEYWQEKSGKIINQVILTGDISKKYYGLATEISKAAKVPVVSAKHKRPAFTKDKSVTDADTSRFMVAIGAGLRDKDSKEKLNFLPHDQKHIIHKKRQEKLIVSILKGIGLASLLVIGMIIAIYVIQIVRSANLNRKINQTRQFTTNHPAQAHVAEAQRTVVAINNVDQLINSQKDMGERLFLIDDIKPENIEITSITFSQLENEEFKIEGISDRADILAFYDAISNKTEANTVSMPYSNLSKSTENKFEINILW